MAIDLVRRYTPLVAAAALTAAAALVTPVPAGNVAVASADADGGPANQAAGFVAGLV